MVSFLVYSNLIKREPNKLPKNMFSEIYLIFDFDCHYSKYSDDSIIEMMNYFDNETENGKLYINYPMVESFYHIKSIPDYDFFNRVVETKDTLGRIYKKRVKEETYIKSKDYFSKRDLFYVIKYNYEKAQQILESKKEDIDYFELLRRQIQRKNEKYEIYVLNTMVLLILDYNDQIRKKIYQLNI